MCADDGTDPIKREGDGVHASVLLELRRTKAESRQGRVERNPGWQHREPNSNPSYSRLSLLASCRSSTPSVRQDYTTSLFPIIASAANPLPALLSANLPNASYGNYQNE